MADHAAGPASANGGAPARTRADGAGEVSQQILAAAADGNADLAGRLQMLMRRLLTSAQIEAAGSRTEPEQVNVLEVITEQLAVLDAAPDAVSICCDPGLLWIVRTLAQANGGDAWYQPADSGGSRFLLRLPLDPCERP